MVEQPSLRTMIQAVLRREGLRPGRDRGQHFLVDPRRLEDLVAWSRLEPGDAVCEIGPGLGTLTRLLLEAGAQVWAFELDQGFHGFLERTLGGRPELRLHHQDGVKGLRSWLKEPSPPADRLYLVSNLPYRITTPILVLGARHPGRIPRMVVTVQWEVATRLAAPAGSSERSRLSAWLERTHGVEILARLDPSSFWPPPRVDSAMVRIEALEAPRFPADAEEFARLLRTVFASRRKTILNNLRGSPFWPDMTRRELERCLQECGIDVASRAEDLEGPALGRLSQRLAKLGSEKP